MSEAVIAQTASGTEKVAEFVDINCESQRGEVDGLLLQMKDYPHAKGVIKIHGQHHDPVTPYQQKETIKNHLGFRQFDLGRFKFVLGDSEARFRTELWKTTADGLAGFDGRPWDYSIEGLRDPLMIDADSWVDGLGCGWFKPDLAFYSKFLKANDSLLGRLVIRDSSHRKFNSRKEELIKKLARDHSIRAERLEFAFIQSENPDTEYWLCPRGSFQHRFVHKP